MALDGPSPAKMPRYRYSRTPVTTSSATKNIDVMAAHKDATFGKAAFTTMQKVPFGDIRTSFGCRKPNMRTAVNIAIHMTQGMMMSIAVVNEERFVSVVLERAVRTLSIRCVTSERVAELVKGGAA